ncbi:MAG: hypothetical protein ACTHLR_06515 [Rhizomicrobium sp.]
MNLRFFAVTSASLFALALASAAAAGPRDDILEALGKCAKITDNSQRLDCYDGLAPRLRDALNTPPDRITHPPTKEEEESWFGFNLDNFFGSAPSNQTTPQAFGADKLAQTAPAGSAAAEQEPNAIDSISAGVTDYSFTPYKKFIVFLDNGQVWRQIEGDTGQARFQRQAKDNTVTIERGAFGSYDMHINDGNQDYKVTRVK